MADFLDIFGEDFSSVLASLDELPPEVETMLLGVMDKMVYDVKTFSNSLEKSVYTMQQAGTSPKIIKQTLANDMGTGGRIFGQLRNDTKASIVDGINQSAKMGQYKNYDLDKGEFVWVAVGGHKVCMDCDARAGQKMTFAGWEAEGLPGSGWSVCQGFCYCVLDPTGKASKKIDAPVKEPGRKVAADKVGWKKAFGSENIPANKAFQDTFQWANDKFKKFLTKIPKIKHISHGSGGSFHSGSRWNQIEKYLKTETSINYLSRHGGINMSSLTGGSRSTTIRHEFGHFIHNNIHYQGVGRGTLNLLAKDYRNSKYYGNPRKFIMEETFYGKVITDPSHLLYKYKYHEKVDGFVSFLKYDDAVVATKKRLGFPSRGKAAQDTAKGWRAYLEELNMKVKYGEKLDDVPSWENIKQYDNIPKGDEFLNALIKDKALDIEGYLQDLFGALTKEKLGHGHGVSYYTERGFVSGQHHEAFANLTALHTHENPIYWNFVKKKMPELAKYYEDLIDDVVSGKLKFQMED